MAKRSDPCSVRWPDVPALTSLSPSIEKEDLMIRTYTQDAPMTGREALEALYVAVSERGTDYIYEQPDGASSCVYFANGEPSCLVGLALYRAGVLDPSTIAEDTNGDAIDVLARLLGLPLTDHAVKILRTAQTSQDREHTWGWAYATAASIIL